MSALSRFGPTVARSALLHHQRHMATAGVASDPVQKLFVDKIREFKASNKGLDEQHQKAMGEEMARLKRVYQVEDEKKLTQFDYKFSNEQNVSLHDLDESKALRQQIASGDYEKQLTAQPPAKSVILESTPEQVQHDLCLPPMNKPDPAVILENVGVMSPPTIGESRPDYEYIGGKMTPERLQRELLVEFGPDMPTIHDDKAPGRDTVNFPRINQPLDTPPTRYHFIPESWFQFFYPKTGVSGPYVFGGSFVTFLLSKEWLVWEHELLTGVTSATIFAIAVNKIGPKLSAYLRNSMQQQCDDWETWRKGSVDFLGEMQDHYKAQLQKSETIKEVYDIRQQDIQMQLEGAYRQRLKLIYDDTKRRLNYLVSVADSQRQIAHRNMVNWVISNAVSSIGAKQETEVLDNCIVSLKQLAKNNANAI